MPPPSPAPGWASGEVCIERTASLRTIGATLLSRLFFPFAVRPAHAGRDHAVLVLVAERQIDAHERLLLVLGQVRVAEDVARQVVLGVALLEDAGPDIERLGRDAQRFGDLLEDLGRRLAQAPLD